MTHPTDEELNALVKRATDAIDRVKPGGILSDNAKLSAALFALYDLLPAITTLRAQLAVVRAALDNANKIMDDWTTLHRVIADIRDASGIGSRLMLSELAPEIGKSIAEANARADRAEAERAAQIEVDAGLIDALYRMALKDSDADLQSPWKPHKASAYWIALQAIRNQPHDRTALDRMLAEAREQAPREAAK